MNSLGRANFALLTALHDAAGPADELVAFCHHSYRPSEPIKRRPSLQKLLRSQEVGAEVECAWCRPDVSYSLTTLVPRKGAKLRVGIVHDLFPLTHLELYQDLPDPETHHAKWKAYFDQVVGTADLVHCISAHTQQAVCEWYGIPLERTFVAMCVLPKYTGERVTGERRTLLSVSMNEPRKNFGRLVESFGVALGRGGMDDVDLVMAGSGTELLTGPRQVRALGRVSEEELRGLYAQATWYACPSLVEGFGLPVVEAMMAGIPVMSSLKGGLADAAGDACLVLDPLDTEQMAMAIHRAFTAEDAVSYTAKGATHINQFQTKNAGTRILSEFRRRV
jgi:glycosyltransferase involved in cell wall biosynthesis